MKKKKKINQPNISGTVTDIRYLFFFFTNKILKICNYDFKKAAFSVKKAYRTWPVGKSMRH